MGKKSLQSFRSYLIHFWENVVCKFLKIRAVLQTKNARTKRHIIDRGMLNGQKLYIKG